MLIGIREREAETLTGTKKKEKRRELNFQPPDTPKNNPSVSQRVRKEERELYNDPPCRVQLVWGEGDRSSGRIASSSCCQIEFVARQGPPQLIQCGTKHNTSTHTHTYTHFTD